MNFAKKKIFKSSWGSHFPSTLEFWLKGGGKFDEEKAEKPQKRQGRHWKSGLRDVNKIFFKNIFLHYSHILIMWAWMTKFMWWKHKLIFPVFGINFLFGTPLKFSSDDDLIPLRRRRQTWFLDPAEVSCCRRYHFRVLSPKGRVLTIRERNSSFQTLDSDFHIRVCLFLDTNFQNRDSTERYMRPPFNAWNFWNLSNSG